MALQRGTYRDLKNPVRALVRDINGLSQLQAIFVERVSEDEFKISVRLEWPTEITETEFFRPGKKFPKPRCMAFLIIDLGRSLPTLSTAAEPNQRMEHDFVFAKPPRYTLMATT